MTQTPDIPTRSAPTPSTESAGNDKHHHSKTLSDLEKIMADGYCLDFSRFAAKFGFHSPVFITRAVCNRFLTDSEDVTGDTEIYRLCGLLTALRGAIRKAPFRYWLWQLFPYNESHPLAATLRTPGDENPEPVFLVFDFTLPDDGGFLPQVTIRLPEQG